MKRLFATTVLTLLTGLTPAVAKAQSVGTWEPITINGQVMIDAAHNQYFWQPSSLERYGNQVTYTTGTVISTPAPGNPKLFITQMTANCQMGTFQGSGTAFNAQNQPTGRFSIPQTTAQPGSFDAGMLMNVCNTTPDIVQVQLEQLGRARQSGAEAIIRAIQAGASMAQ